MMLLSNKMLLQIYFLQEYRKFLIISDHFKSFDSFTKQ